MARTAKPTSSKSRAGGKARQQTGTKSTGAARKGATKNAGSKKSASAKGGAAPKTRSVSKRATSGSLVRNAQPQAVTLAAGVGALLGTQFGREILAEVLNAAAGVLRRSREQVQEAGQAMLGRSTDLASTAVNVGTEVASGAVEAGAEITAAAVDIAQTAAGTLAAVSTNAVLNMIPGAGAGGEEGQEGAEDNRGDRERAGAGKG